MVATQTRSTIQQGRGAFWGEAVFVGVAADTGNAFEAEVKGRRGETSAGKERDKKGAETAVHMEGEGFANRQTREGRYIVYNTMREGGSRADEEDGVAVDQARDAGDVNVVGGSWAGDEVDFDAEVGAGF